MVPCHFQARWPEEFHQVPQCPLQVAKALRMRRSAKQVSPAISWSISSSIICTSNSIICTSSSIICISSSFICTSSSIICISSSICSSMSSSISTIAGVLVLVGLQILVPDHSNAAIDAAPPGSLTGAQGAQLVRTALDAWGFAQTRTHAHTAKQYIHNTCFTSDI